MMGLVNILSLGPGDCRKPKYSAHEIDDPWLGPRKEKRIHDFFRSFFKQVNSPDFYILLYSNINFSIS